MPRSRPHTSINSVCVFIGGLFILLSPSLHAQDDGMAFPRDALNWYLRGDVDRLWEHTSPGLQQILESPDGLRESQAELGEAFGEETSVLVEQLFPHPEDDSMSVYIRASRHANVPEMFWVVTFSPTEQQLLVIMPQPRQTIRTLFPQVRLP